MDNTYIFMHSEWSDLCVLNNNIIERKSIEYEKGTFTILDKELIIKWEKWDGNDIFVLFNNYYYHKIFYEKYIINKKLNNIKVYYENYNYDLIVNYEENYIFKKFDINKIGKFTKKDNIFIITWNSLIEEKFIIINEKYYDYNYLTKLLETNIINNNIDHFLKINSSNTCNPTSNTNTSDTNTIYSINNKDSVIIEKFKKINNNLYFKSYSSIFNNIIKKSIYNVIDFKIDYNTLKNKVGSLLFDNVIENKNYLNKNNINKYLNNFPENKNTFDYFLKLELNFEIPVKKNKRILSLVEWAYPPFGGGENWILNFNKILHNNNYDNFIICFSDNFKNIFFTETKLIDIHYVKIIQMPKDIISIIKIIKVINPDIINHQGVYREYFMKISNILEIPFLTGFCFWQNIVKFNISDININMINNNFLEKTDEFEMILKNSYTYSSSDFVNDIINKLYNKKLDVIETISLKEDFYVDNNNDNQIYVTLINCHYNKGGYLLETLCNNLDINIPLQLVYTENDPIINIDYLTTLINNRNQKKNINKLIREKIDVKIIYNKTRIMLIPSLCDETFCRVGYEAMINKIPTISLNNGNLKYLLKDYAIFIDSNPELWLHKIEKLYFDVNLFDNFKSKNVSILNEEYIEKKILNKINSIVESKYKLDDKNIGLIIPWADQGLGIQGREYYITIKNIGYNPYVLSFKPYHATHENIKLQTDSSEWNYQNIHYSPNYREDLTNDEILDFVYKYNIKKIIIIEATYIHIFRIAIFLKLINIKVYLAINLECLRLEELDYHYIFDKIITNNLNSHLIMSKIFDNKIFNLGFHLTHQYFQNNNKIDEKNKINNIINKKEKLRFFCSGGLNAISRKNIDIIIIVFYNIFKDNIYLNWELNVYIQGVQIPEIINQYICPNIKYHLHNLPYKSIIDKYFEYDIFIHMGSHEGLGLGFYESIYCGTPILSMNWIPNNEVIHDNINGWLIDCNYSDIYDNDYSLLNKGIIYENTLKEKIVELLQNKDNTINIINNTLNNIENISKKNKISFENNFLNILS
jgi:hypothetical protein